MSGNKKQSYIKSPLNYMGGKYAILGDILPLFPAHINKFVDLFAGGLNVGINVNAKTIFVNDQLDYLVELYEYLRKIPTTTILSDIEKKIKKYNLDRHNTAGFNSLRHDYNVKQNPLDLFVLTCFSFNHQIRFNSSFQFNTPFGKERSSYNNSIKNNLIAFCNKLKEGNFVFTSKDFRKFPFSSLTVKDVVYCDPPYLITNGSYNDGKRGFDTWTEKEDIALFKKLDSLARKGVPFYLSNVFCHKGQTNERLIEWSRKYRVIFIEKNYSNCNYQFKRKNTETKEVLITNFGVKYDK